MNAVVHGLGVALLTASGMFWQVGWSLVLGFVISGVLQAVVSRDAMTRVLGSGGPREVALAAVAGAASSSCSYAAASVCRTLFAGGAALAPSLAFLVASTNLVAELGLILLLLMGWQFMAGEWLGGVLMVALLAALVRLTAPRGLVEAARQRARAAAGGHAHGEAAGAGGLLRRETWVRVAHAFAHDWSMLGKDLLLGFVIAGLLAAFVPDGVWQALFLHGAPGWVQVPGNALIGPLVAVVSFVCSIGNVPMAAVLWGAGVSFGGVLAFLYADLLVLPLLDVYRRQFGWRMAAYMAAVLYVTMAAAALAMNLLFGALGWIPGHHAHAVPMTDFRFNYTFYLNICAILVTVVLYRMHLRHPAPKHSCHAHGGAMAAHAHPH